MRSSSSSARRHMGTSASNVMYTNAVYFPNQKIYENFTPGMMDYGCVSHVYYAFANVLADGTVLVFTWEYPSDAQQGADFVALLAAIRIHLPEEQFFVTAALPAGTSVLQHINIAQAAAYLDFVNLMAYDFCGPWEHRSGHHAQLYSLQKDEVSGSSGVSYLIANGCPSKKILLGIPVYGRSFLGVSGPGHRHKGPGGRNGAFEYHELPRKHAKETVDKRIGAASCVGGDGGFVSYDNPETVKMKAAFCKQKGLGGLFYWSGPADSQEKGRSLIAAGFKSLHSS
ncbi:hypothetical protein DL764_000524 [Monosporascus ibericus]|uniref:chitinase n=1 Tax=Monosporascus ibericus TaxID=155417 RepID=A0A4Q4TYB2_9PEZI|nr:hypothetical protein DL764_000524 [Monosporascus ibericus]